ncbi:MAG: hypothetical protein J1E35_00825 [Lachnospiraceae bacterium]|nr:hypothetical protein [Lachnospiraceae bacterium]
MSRVKTRNYEYQGKKEEKKVVPNKKIRTLVIGGGSLFILLLVVLVAVESGLKNKIVIKNRSTHKITSLQIWYEDNSGNMTEVMNFGEVPAKKKVTESTEELELSKILGEAWLTVQIAFEDGGKAVLQTGQFFNDFNGKISFEVSDTKTEELMLRLRAGEGLFNSTAVTNCDDVYYINPKNGYIE